eukprot:7815668-Karenia_brevis.AAC.1
MIEQMRGTPQQPDPSKPGMHIPVRVNFEDFAEDEPEETVERRFAPRRMKITKSMLKDVGYTDDCEGCDAQKAGLAVPKNHTEQCRRRVEKEMEKTEAGMRKRREEEE